MSAIAFKGPSMSPESSSCSSSCCSGCSSGTVHIHDANQSSPECDVYKCEAAETLVSHLQR